MSPEMELPVIFPCSSCGGTDQRIESSRPLGRTVDVWRVVCACGSFPAQWSVSKPAAIRLWNRYMTGNSDIPSGRSARSEN